MIESVKIHEIYPDFLLKDKNGRAMAKALQAAMDYFLARCKAGVDIVLDPEKMPEWRLDEMAWETNCLYDYSADVEIKRGWIRDVYKNYRLHGTAEGIRQYLKIYFGESVVTECFEYGGEPGEFFVTVTGLRTDANDAWTRNAVAKAKNVRSTLTGIVFNSDESSGADVKIGAAVVGMFIQDESVLM